MTSRGASGPAGWRRKGSAPKRKKRREKRKDEDPTKQDLPNRVRQADRMFSISTAQKDLSQLNPSLPALPHLPCRCQVTTLLPRSMVMRYSWPREKERPLIRDWATNTGTQVTAIGNALARSVPTEARLGLMHAGGDWNYSLQIGGHTSCVADAVVLSIGKRT